jgi:hypothetical protein
MKFDYYTSTWDRLIKKTQTNDEYLKRGEYKWSQEREKQDWNCENRPVYNEPQSVKHSSTKIIDFKPPLGPKNSDITGCGR